MLQRSIRLALTVVAVAISLGLAPAGRSLAAPPGAQILDTSGTLPAGQSRLVTFFDTGEANVRVNVGGGPAGNALSFAVKSAAGTAGSWAVRSGETTWGYVTIPAGAQLEITNPTASALDYHFVAFARATLPSIAEGLSAWGGVSAGAGTSSAAQFTAPTAGRYTFTMAASSGSFQLKVDDTAIVKTVAQGVAVDPADSTYYLSAGPHTFAIVQNPSAATTAWSVAIAPVGGADILPTAEGTGVLGGGFFSAEWVPIQLEAAQVANIQVAVTGGATNSLAIEIYSGDTKTATGPSVFGGESVTFDAALAAGANRLHVVAAPGNGAPLAYVITVTPVPQAPTTWTGTAFGAPAHPSGDYPRLRVSFPTAGLYTFRVAAPAGRYQLLLGESYLRRTVSGTGAVEISAYVPAGEQVLTVAQDPAVASTSWSVEISGAGAPADQLPFTRQSSAFGGAGDAFREEWLPLQASFGQQVNLRVSLNGAPSDSVLVELYQGPTLVSSMAAVYGGEVVFSTTALAPGANRLHILASGGNAAPATYQVDVLGVSSVPTSWQGISLGGGLRSVVTVNAPATGIYTLTLTVSEGAGDIAVDQAAQPASVRRSAALSASTTTFRIPLTAGAHTIQLRQDAGQPRTVWAIGMEARQEGPYVVSLPVVAR